MRGRGRGREGGEKEKRKERERERETKVSITKSKFTVAMLKCKSGFFKAIGSFSYGKRKQTSTKCIRDETTSYLQLEYRQS